MIKIYRVFYHYNGNRQENFYMDIQAENHKNALENVWGIVGKGIIRNKVIILKNRMSDLNHENKVEN